MRNMLQKRLIIVAFATFVCFELSAQERTERVGTHVIKAQLLRAEQVKIYYYTWDATSGHTLSSDDVRNHYDALYIVRHAPLVEDLVDRLLLEAQQQKVKVDPATFNTRLVIDFDTTNGRRSFFSDGRNLVTADYLLVRVIDEEFRRPFRLGKRSMLEAIESPQE